MNDETDLNINEFKTDGIFSSRFIFNELTDLDSTELYDDEIKIAQPDVYKFLTGLVKKSHHFIKIHDAYSFNTLDQPIVPTAPTLCAIYIMGNPLDIAASLASHINRNIEQAIELLNNPFGTLGSKKNNINTGRQLNQLMYNWTGHVNSWTAKLPFPVLVIRYEDMLADALNTFSKATQFMGVNKTNNEIRQAIDACNFDKLKQKEEKGGFKETLHKEQSFFRQGKAGNFINELSPEQIASIIEINKNSMEKHGYLPLDASNS